MAATEANKRVVQRAFDAWDTGDASAFDEVYAEEVEHANVELGGVEELKTVLAAWFEAFPDLTHTVDAMLAEGDWVATRFRISGTHEGEFQGIEPTGASFEVDGMAMERVEGGQIVERWLIEDLLSLYAAIGAVEPPA